MPVHPERIRLANSKQFDPIGEHVTYWMQASQRVQENPALAHAIELANAHKKKLLVYFCITTYPGAQRAHYDFMVEGIAEVAASLAKRGIEFLVEIQKKSPVDAVLSLHSCAVVCDENYTRVPRLWRARLADEAPVQVIIVDANLVVPARLLDREEYAAYTIRPKLWARASAFLRETKLPKYHAVKNLDLSTIPKLTLELHDKARRTQSGGEKAAHLQLKSFISRIDTYSQRNDPTELSTSNLSSYLHFGQISPVTIVHAVSASATARTQEVVDAFIEQVFVRREVAHNFTYFNSKYDSVQGCAAWAQATLAKHARDKREYLYSKKELEAGKTHDELWNAAQQEMVRTGHMHNYMRMLWAKKILEWTNTPEEAFSIALELNDTYELDGRDPNGYTGIAWSIGGKHDRPWFERSIYGQVRFMSSTAAAKKFDAARYIKGGASPTGNERAHSRNPRY